MVTACTTTSTHSSPQPTPSPVPKSLKIKFADCTTQVTATIPASNALRLSRLTYFCGRVSVPVDWARPAGRQIQLYVLKVHDNTQLKPTGDLIVNPGGPGQSGVQEAINLSLTVSDRLLRAFDVVGFDPRGVFLSDPVSCIANTTKDALYAADPDVGTAAGLAAAQKLARTVGAACTTKYGTDLQYIDTMSTARDMDRVRTAVGDPSLNYLGYSYGTVLGAAYAHLHPATVRAMVLDGAVLPDADPVAAGAQQAASLERAFAQFASACPHSPTCRALANPRTALPALIARADRSPIPARGSGRRATGGLILAAVVASLYTPASWPQLGSALVQARDGDAAAVLALADSYTGRDASGRYSQSLDAQTTIMCNDTGTRPSDSRIRATARGWERKYPIFGRNAAAALVMCQQWRTPRHPIGPVSANLSTPALVVGTVHDPVTPYASATTLARELTSATVLGWNGEGHTAYPQTTCIQHAVDDYLIALTVPASNTLCPR